MSEEEVPLMASEDSGNQQSNFLLPCIKASKANRLCGRCDGVSLKEAYNPLSMFTSKPVEVCVAESQANVKGRRLDRALGLIDLIGYGVGCTVGAGIYSLIGVGVGIAGGCLAIYNLNTPMNVIMNIPALPVISGGHCTQVWYMWKFR